ncbi:alpha/beta hydrolase fold domain-containing protein [Pandoraea fibrosis]|uniref:Alpha/beta hydrolase fold domain-containing protein n=1 Tax=Pandoraea fibrosis TaxID=1891094 RepID=A0ABX6HQP6_9BURK|nr:alpha/beta hydrolase [Pandoraea fibrosis]QHE93218.1 alpha/beta hydrolase fold domain-containing protein [Pandoraea fibrosis]QHF13223.1 alpha/beta hydrolase fold domain-containing protein [Pandoraea fibrosis]
MKSQISQQIASFGSLSLAPQIPLPSAAALAYEALVLDWAQRPTEGLRVARNLAYGDDPLHRFDVFSAPGMPDDAPIVVFFHGGGWTNGYKEYVTFMASNVVASGCVLVAPSYRLAPAAALPAALLDGAALLAALPDALPDWAAGAQHRTRRVRRVVLSGHSAGGHLAALLTLRPDVLALAGANPADIIGCLPISGIFDLHHPAPATGSLEARVYEMVLGPDTDDALMSPLCWTRGNRVPMVLSWGEHDSARVALSNQRMASLLNAQGAPCATFVESGADHFQTHTRLADPAHAWYRRLASIAHHGTVPID